MAWRTAYHAAYNGRVGLESNNPDVIELKGGCLTYNHAHSWGITSNDGRRWKLVKRIDTAVAREQGLAF